MWEQNDDDNGGDIADYEHSDGELDEENPPPEKEELLCLPSEIPECVPVIRSTNNSLSLSPYCIATKTSEHT